MKLGEAMCVWDAMLLVSVSSAVKVFDHSKVTVATHNAQIASQC